MPSFDVEFVVDLPAARLWAALRDGNKIFPKILPHMFASIENIAGDDGEPGAVRLIKFGSAVPGGAFVKEELVTIDQNSKALVSQEIEGGHLAVGFTKWVTNLKLTPDGDKTQMSFTFDVEGEGPVVEPAIEQAKLGTAPAFQAFAAYVLESGEYA